MDQIVSFIQNYWQAIAAVLELIIMVILMIIKKKPMSLDQFQSAWDEAIKKIPSLIGQIEIRNNNDKCLTGLGKKEFVIQRTIKSMEDSLGRELTSKELDKVLPSFDRQIECVLSCPTKKGGLGREQVEQKKK